MMKIQSILVYYTIAYLKTFAANMSTGAISDNENSIGNMAPMQLIVNLPVCNEILFLLS